MQKLNNKGLSLIEILVSITLISIILVFLVQLLNGLEGETTNNNFAYDNQINRAEIIKTIEEDLKSNNLIGVSNNSNDNINLYFDFLNNFSSTLTSTTKETINNFGEKEINYILKYTASNGEKYSWTMKGAQIDPCFDFAFHNDLDTNNYYFKLNIYVYNKPYHKRNNKDINNVIDDIEITYSDNNNLLSKDSKYLTIDSNSDKNINSCTN